MKVRRCTTICTNERRRFREIFVAADIPLRRSRSSFVRGNLKDDGLIHRATCLSVITLKRCFLTSASQRPRDKRHEIEISRHFGRPLISGIPRFTVSESFRTTPRTNLSPFSFTFRSTSECAHSSICAACFLPVLKPVEQ